MTSGRDGQLRPGRSSSGFTLLELIVVVTLTGVLAVFAGPSLTGLVTAQRELVTTRARQVLIHAQQTAMTHQLDTWVVVDVDADTLSAYVEDPTTPGRAHRVTLTDPLAGGALVLDLSEGPGIASVDFNETVELHYDEDGVPHDLDGVALTEDGTLVLDGGLTVRVTRNTGLVTVD